MLLVRPPQGPTAVWENLPRRRAGDPDRSWLPRRCTSLHTPMQMEYRVSHPISTTTTTPTSSRGVNRDPRSARSPVSKGLHSNIRRLDFSNDVFRPGPRRAARPQTARRRTARWRTAAHPRRVNIIRRSAGRSTGGRRTSRRIGRSEA